MSRGKIKVVALDFDGTVVDTMPRLAELGTKLIAWAYGVNERVARGCFMMTVGAPFSAQLERLFPGHDGNRAVAAAFARSKLDIFATARVFREVYPALRLLRRYGFAVCVCSSTDESLVRRVIARNHLEWLVNRVEGTAGDDTKAEQIASFVDAIGLASSDAVFIGDAPLDAEYAAQAGVGFLAVETTFAREEFALRNLASEPDVLKAVERIVYA